MITFGVGNWDGLLQKAYMNLNPGGWIELQEVRFPPDCDDGSVNRRNAIWKWGQEIRKAAKELGIDTLASLEYHKKMKRIGFCKLNEVVFKIPLGTWVKGKTAKKIGSMGKEIFVAILEGMSTRLLLKLGYQLREIDDLLRAVRADLENPNASLGLSLLP